MRKSSRGNPWHDARGRFCHGPQATTDTWGNPISDEQRNESVLSSERTPEEYAQRTQERLVKYKTDSVVDVGAFAGGEVQKSLAEGAIIRNETLNRCYQIDGYDSLPLAEKNKVYDKVKQEVSLEKAYVEGVTTGNYDDFERISSEYTAKYGYEEYRKARDRAMDESMKNKEVTDILSREDRAVAMREEVPWETDRKYAGRKNAKLLWLQDHPDHKYNSPGFINGIKRIERMADTGVSAEMRRDTFRQICKQNGITEEEGRNFIAPEFLE